MLDESTAGPSTTLPRISCGTWWLRQTSCAFLYGKAHTLPCLVQCGRKSGYAPVGMTIHIWVGCECQENCYPDKKVTTSRDDKGDSGASMRIRMPVERTAGPSTSLRS